MNTHQISVEELAALIGRPDCPLLIDTRNDEDFAADPRMLPCARRQSHLAIAHIVERIRGRKVVVYCQKGLKLSIGAAAVLHLHGIKASYLAGGQFAWRDAGLPMVEAGTESGFSSARNRLWVAPARPHLLAAAEIWFVRRFLDPDARIIYVDPKHRQAVAEKFDAMVLGSGEMNSGFSRLIEQTGIHFDELSAFAAALQHQSDDQDALSDLHESAKTIWQDDHDLEASSMTLLDAAFQSTRNRKAAA